METTIEKKEVTMDPDNVIIFDLFEVVFRRVASTPPQVAPLTQQLSIIRRLCRPPSEFIG